MVGNSNTSSAVGASVSTRHQAPQSSGTTARTYVCEVEGCGKSFARGEHLKRHVKSIHNYEKRKIFFFALKAI